MADEAVVTDSAVPAEAAPPAAATQDDATHGDATEQQATSPETEGASVETSESEDDDESESLPETATDDEKTKSQQRRERREARQQKLINDAVAAAREQERQELSAKASAEAVERVRADQEKAWTAEFGSLVGTPEIYQALDAEISDLTRQVTAIRPYAENADFDKLDQLQTRLDTKLAEKARLSTNAETYRKIDEFQFAMTKGHYQALVNDIPPEHRPQFLASSDVPTALARYKAGLLASVETKYQADKATAIKAVTELLEKERAAHAATRTGAPGSGPSLAAGGMSGGNGGSLTMERYRAMDSTERAKLRATPEGRAQIDAMTRRGAA